ncbi:MAG: bifunctional oligoribonuclease/PAP phosphatase NrnA [Clostridiales bacterium]|nr:bifunctional oligoribonuclease/PAP phosphatase NrnA [Clostridiales bacterium]
MKDLYIEGATRIAKLMLNRAEELKASGGCALIFPHKSVDGDCVGSSSALASLLRTLGAKAWVCMPEELPNNMSFLGIDDLLFYPPKDFIKGDMLVNGNRYELAFSVDCSEAHRMGDTGEIFDVYEDQMDVDHHEVMHLAGPLRWIEPQASSACEMVFYVASKLSELKNVPLDQIVDIRCAKCLMAGVVTDTGRFTYSNTRPETLETAGILMELGGDITEVCYNLFDLKTPSEFAISSAACSNAYFCCDGRLAIAEVTSEMFERYKAGRDEIADVVSRLRDVGGVEFACVLRETGEGSIRGNLRSKTDFDCSLFAERYGGGGHKRAAGFTVVGRDINELAQEIVREASKLL